jgi:hypothetical protein
MHDSIHGYSQEYSKLITRYFALYLQNYLGFCADNVVSLPDGRIYAVLWIERRCGRPYLPVLAVDSIRA